MKRLVGLVALAVGVVAVGRAGGRQVAPKAAPIKLLKVVFERTPCYGTCPVYRVTLMADGTVTYNGIRFVKRKGVHKGKFWAYDFERLSSYIQQSGFMKLKDHYEVLATDQPTHILTVVTSKGTKRVSQYGSQGPLALWTLQTLIDGLSETAKYEDE